MRFRGRFGRAARSRCRSRMRLRTWRPSRRCSGQGNQGSGSGLKSKERRGFAMAIRTILQLGDPGLREVAKKLTDPAAPQIQALVEDLADTLAFWRKSTGYGRGIAAPQIGANLRVIFLGLPGEEPWPLVNPEITWRSAEKIVVWDACLSFLSIFMQVERHRDIKVRYQDLRAVWHEVGASEERNLSELLQHEIDHLDGILAVDRIIDMKTMCTREEFEKRYRAGSPYAVAPAGREAASS